MARPIKDQEQFADLGFPRAGIDLSRAFVKQMPRPMADGSYGNTTAVGLNVRTFEPTTNRSRGGQRAGLSRYIATQPAGMNVIQELFTLVGVGYTDPGGSMQQSASGRVVNLVAVSGGNVYVATAGGTGWTAAVNSTSASPPLITSGVVRSTSLNQKLWYADGAHWCYYDPADNAVHIWAATAGSLPVDNAGNLPRLICTWRGRMILSGLENDPQNWFMSAVSDPTNWDYAPAAQNPAQAIAGNNSALGLIGDVVTTMIPYTDDVLIMGGDHTLWQFSGDPMAGGQIDLISDAIGIAWGIPWCKGPDGTIYFVSNRTGVYALTPGQGAPVRISQQIEQLLIPIDTGTNTIRLIWDDRFQGLHIFITPTATQSVTTHFFWEQRATAWWQDSFANVNHNPLCCCVFDGNTPGDRRPLIGSWDGFVRSIDPAASTDDGYPISSSVMLGPLLTVNMDEILLKDVQAVLGQTSGSIAYAIYVGATAEIALSNTPVATGVWNPGRNLLSHVRRSGHAVWIQLSASNPWALEAIRCRIAGQGKVRQRGH